MKSQGSAVYTWRFHCHLVLHVEVGAEHRQAGDHSGVGNVEENLSADAVDAKVGVDGGDDVDDAEDDRGHVGLDG